ncbi:speract/scavenger receptor domain-containing protein [Heterostelium album PN500]|uniref:Speract/scavenger receptor domain-containing protein n=1 Tax=Heterostelium pallidum (strain ATCC 26659 / Pp 5 / PN500) TaxID=670386 RepID=D3BU04_HETP5|nr:speract/scavenger receptor domain-containing protein [Heterostelium album PN500]EFA75190.1 speract/scavenger receptor domain-containing protein [Heterostelium album PN500]|eukprot:XP_020427324.1 speract/scavenger receptor domain-containing protein [Heterostelium album PN500]
MFKQSIILLVTYLTISTAIPFGQVFTGQASYYNDAGTGSCGTSINAATQMLVAAPAAHWTSANPNSDPLCNNVFIKVTYNGNTITVPVKDKCPSCPANKIDLSQPAFSALANTDLGIIPITWEYVSGSTGGSTTTGPSSTTGSGSCGNTATVAAGEGCYQVWTAKCGKTWDQNVFNQYNPGVNCNALQVGQQLCCGSGSGSSTTGTAPCSIKKSVASGDGCYQVWTAKCGNAWDEPTFYSKNPGVNCAALQVGQQLCCN